MNDSETCLLQKLQDMLKQAIIRSWSSAIERHPNEHFYGYVLFTAPTLAYLVPSYNSEESLARMAVNDSNYLYLQWSPDEWEYYLENQSFFDPVNKILTDLELATDFHNVDVFSRRWNAIVETLLELDRENLFGEGDSRSKITVNIMWGDQDTIAHINSARQLNPQESYLRFAQSQLALFRNVRDRILERESKYQEAALRDIDRTIDSVVENIKIFD